MYNTYTFSAFDQMMKNIEVVRLLVLDLYAFDCLLWHMRYIFILRKVTMYSDGCTSDSLQSYALYLFAK